MSKWFLIGLGYISQRHIQAIEDIGDKLVMVCDIDESKKDKVPDAKFYSDYIRATKDPLFKEVDWVAICTPNYLHFPMAMNMLKMGKNVLCEKPLVIKTSHIGTLNFLPKYSNFYTVLQLRHNQEMQFLKSTIKVTEKYEGSINLNVHRGEFYGNGWKGDKEKSGGLLFNIGIHYFDLLIWLFGEPLNYVVHENNGKSASGTLTFANAKIIWHLSIEAPMDNQIKRLTINGKNVDLTRHFEDLHTAVYRDAKAGKGITMDEAGRAVRLVEKMSA